MRLTFAILGTYYFPLFLVQLHYTEFFSSINVDITGLGHLEHISDLITGVIETYFQQIIIEAINLVIQIPIQRVVNSINESIDAALGRNSTETEIMFY